MVRRRVEDFLTRLTTNGSYGVKAHTLAVCGSQRCALQKRWHGSWVTTASASHYHEMFLKAQSTYINKLWNGEYFRYDTESEYSDNIQADQLAGQWYADMTGLGDLVPREMRLKALGKIFATNVMQFADGEMGAVNGIGRGWLNRYDQRTGSGGMDRNDVGFGSAHVQRGNED